MKNKDAPTKEDMRTYRRIIKAALKRKKLSEICIRLTGEYHQIRNIKPLCVSSKLREALEQVPLLGGWRKNIWINLQETIFRKTKDVPNDDKFHKFGVATSLFDNMLYGLDKVRKSTPGMPSIKTILKPYELTGEKEHTEAKKSLLHYCHSLKAIEKKWPDLPPSAKEQIAKGETVGARGVYDDEGKYTHSTPATPIYGLLLYLGEYLEQLSSRKKMYYFLKIILGKNMPHDEEAFTLICKRIGLKGSKGRERDENNARVTLAKP